MFKKKGNFMLTIIDFKFAAEFAYYLIIRRWYYI